MKRQLSLVLALVMILGSFSAVFAAEMPTTPQTKAEFLQDKKILKGNLEGELNLAQDLKRRDALVVLSRLFGVEEEAQAYPSNDLSFTDITDDYYAGFIAWAVEEGYTNGKTETIYDLNGPLLTQQFATFLLRALEYEENGENIFDRAYEEATKLGILDNVELEKRDTIKRSEMATMTFDALSVKVNGKDVTLAEKLGIEMPEAPAAKDLTAKVNATENLKEVVVELSNAKLADADKLQDDQNYKLAGFVVERAELVGNNVVLLLDEALVKGRTYSLTIRNIDKAINKKYTFKAEDNTLPKVEEVTVLGEYGIKVTTSEPIKDAKERNFLIDGRNVSMKVEQYGRDIILTPYYGSAFASNAAKLTIKELEDYALFKSVEQDFEIAIVKDSEAPKVTDMISRGNVVEVTFDKDIYDDSVGAYLGRTNVGNISYQSGRQTIYAKTAEKTDINKVKYTFEKELPRRTALTLVDVSNHSKVGMDKITQEPRLVLDYSEPEIMTKNVTTTATTATVTLKFDKEVEGNFINPANLKEGFVVANHFTLFERDVYRGQEANKITSAKYAETAAGVIIKDTVVVTMAGLTEYKLNVNDLNYVLEVENFTDATSLRNKMYRDYVDFKAQSGTAFRVTDIKTKAHYLGTEITINVNKPLDKVLAEQYSNYLFQAASSTLIKDIADLQGSVYAEQNGTVITIILPRDKFDATKYGTLTILNNIKDINGNRFNAPVVYDFATGLTSDQVLTLEQELASLVIKANTTPYNVDSAVIAALALPTGTYAQKEAAVTALENAIKAVDEAALLLDANTKVQTVESTITRANYELAKLAVNELEEGTVKNNLKARLVVVEFELLEIEAVATAKVNLDLGNLSAVKTNLTLPTTQDDATVSWSSDTPLVLSNTGVVTRPAYTVPGGDVIVTLTATITNGTTNDTKVFSVKVMQKDFTVGASFPADSKAQMTVDGYSLSDFSAAAGSIEFNNGNLPTFTANGITYTITYVNTTGVITVTPTGTAAAVAAATTETINVIKDGKTVTLTLNIPAVIIGDTPTITVQ